MMQRHPVVSYFALTFTISWLAAIAVAVPHLLRREPLPKMTGLLMFPAMLLGPCLAGLLCTWVVDGRAGVHGLLSRMLRLRVSIRWYAAVLIPPLLVFAVLSSLSHLISGVYAPNRFLLGVLFAVPAGLIEEIGWTGFAFPAMCRRHRAFTAAVLLGLLWSTWHWPVIDFLGTATPHGNYRLPFFVSFSLAMTAMRVLISWVYTNTSSVAMAQLLHISSTGSLIVFGPPLATPAQEAAWYAVYGLVLWSAVAVVVLAFGLALHRSPKVRYDAQRSQAGSA
jgi:membrane protease YdiL (CAAX protease family)